MVSFTDSEARFLARRHLYRVTSPSGVEVRGDRAVLDRLGIDPGSVLGAEAEEAYATAIGAIEAVTAELLEGVSV